MGRASQGKATCGSCTCTCKDQGCSCAGSTLSNCSGCADELSRPKTHAQDVSRPKGGQQERAQQPKPTAPRHLLAPIAQKVAHLASLSARCVVYERHEILNAQGEVMERHVRGHPFVLRRGLGLVPIDAQSPHLDDGSSIRKDHRCYTDEQGRWHRVTQYRRLPPPPHGSQPQANGRQDAHKVLERKKRDLDLLTSHQHDPIPVAISLRDEEILPRVPARAITGLAFTQHGRSDRLTPLRRQILNENRRKRRLWALPLRAWLRSLSMPIEFQAASYRNVLYAWIPKKHLSSLLARNDVLHVEPRPLKEAPDDTLTEVYLCEGTSARSNLNKDTEPCANKLFDPPIAYMDGLNAATGVLQYVNAGYDGMISGGNSDWSVLRGSPTLSVAIRDGQFFATHVAFRLDGTSRFQYFFVRVDRYGDVEVHTDIETVEDRTDDAAHGTCVAAIAMSDVTDGQDSELTTDEARFARSGVARRVVGLASLVTLPYMLEEISTDFATGPDGDSGGIDVVVSSISGNSMTSEPITRRYDCPTEDEARGIDDVSIALVDHFIYEDILFAKSAGNTGDYNVRSICTVGSSGEVSSPGASPAALSVGGLDASRSTPNEMQDSTTLNDHTSGATTLDGRTYPSLIALSYQCGVASVAEAYWPDATDYAYTGFGGSSACAPRLGGAALLFKHWFLEQFGADGRDPGITLVNMLNFADGYVEADDSGGGVRAAPPSPWWGLGRFRMRLISQDGLAPRHGWGTASFCLEDGRFEAISICETGKLLPPYVRHLRITAWWLEVNTGEHETKAHISMSLVTFPIGGGFDFTVDTVETDVEQVLRLQYDRYDSTFPCPPGMGSASIVFWGESIPPDERSPNRGACREVFVSWLWEAGDDPSEIVCDSDTPKISVCGSPVGSSIPLPGGPTKLPIDAPAPLLAMRRALDATIREVIPIATGVSDPGGAFPTGEEVKVS